MALPILRRRVQRVDFIKNGWQQMPVLRWTSGRRKPEQPVKDPPGNSSRVAGDLRQISAALKMITDMERIGDQAEDIAEIIAFLNGRSGAECGDIDKMAKAATKMVTNSIEAFVKRDVELAKEVIAQDDIVDDYFNRVKQDLIERISSDPSDGEFALDLLMIAKYFERIGDHATNIAEWVMFSVTGVHVQNE